jgi:hypothetical protein
MVGPNGGTATASGAYGIGFPATFAVPPCLRGPGEASQALEPEQPLAGVEHALRAFLDILPANLRLQRRLEIGGGESDALRLV